MVKTERVSDHPAAMPPPEFRETAELPVDLAIKPASTGWILLGLVLLAGLLAGLFALGYVPKLHRAAVLEAEATRIRTQAPVVNVGKAKVGPAARELILPGTIQALRETTIYARANGYLKQWFVDMGDEVKEGQLVAEIDTPELDQELRQAEASGGQAQARLATAQANADLARTTLERYRSIAQTKAVSAQDLAEREAAFESAKSNVEAARADVKAAEANVRRFTDLKSFARVLAPFDGTITFRSIEVGQLITSGNGKDQELFRISQFNTLRIFVSVPQSSALLIQPGQTAELTVNERPGRKFIGAVSRTSQSLDTASRTLLTEVRVPNKDRALLTGMYARVKFTIRREHPPLVLPESAMIMNAEGTQVATVGPDRKVHFHKIELEEDYGAQIAVASGISPQDEVILNPGERLVDGLVVTPHEGQAD